MDGHSRKGGEEPVSNEIEIVITATDETSAGALVVEGPLKRHSSRSLPTFAWSSAFEK